MSLPHDVFTLFQRPFRKTGYVVEIGKPSPFFSTQRASLCFYAVGEYLGIPRYL